MSNPWTGRAALAWAVVAVVAWIVLAIGGNGAGRLVVAISSTIGCAAWTWGYAKARKRER